MQLKALADVNSVHKQKELRLEKCKHNKKKGWIG